MKGRKSYFIFLLWAVCANINIGQAIQIYPHQDNPTTEAYETIGLRKKDKPKGYDCIYFDSASAEWFFDCKKLKYNNAANGGSSKKDYDIDDMSENEFSYVAKSSSNSYNVNKVVISSGGSSNASAASNIDIMDSSNLIKTPFPGIFAVKVDVLHGDAEEFPYFSYAGNASSIKSINDIKKSYCGECGVTQNGHCFQLYECIDAEDVIGTEAKDESFFYYGYVYPHYNDEQPYILDDITGEPKKDENGIKIRVDNYSAANNCWLLYEAMSGGCPDEKSCECPSSDIKNKFFKQKDKILGNNFSLFERRTQNICTYENFRRGIRSDLPPDLDVDANCFTCYAPARIALARCLLAASKSRYKGLREAAVSPNAQTRAVVQSMFGTGTYYCYYQISSSKLRRIGCIKDYGSEVNLEPMPRIKKNTTAFLGAEVPKSFSGLGEISDAADVDKANAKIFDRNKGSKIINRYRNNGIGSAFGSFEARKKRYEMKTIYDLFLRQKSPYADVGKLINRIYGTDDQRYSVVKYGEFEGNQELQDIRLRKSKHYRRS